MKADSRYLEQRPSIQFENAWLHALDFDGTMYNTFEQDTSRNIYGVDEAYRIAIEETFDFDRDALRKYEDQGEHNNRTPLEIAHALAPGSTPEGLERLTNQLVGAKLNVLAKQIGKTLADGEYWPRPMPGFVEYARTIRESDLPITQAILSAGHASFIRKCLDISGLQQPEIMVTDETIRGLNSSLSPEDLAKPSPLPMSLAKVQWLNLYGYGVSDPIPGGSINPRIVMVGDSLEKDGGLATNTDVKFIYISPGNSAEGWNSLLQIHGLGQNAAAGV